MKLKICRFTRFIYKKFVNRPITVVLGLPSFIYLFATVLIMISENVAFGEATARIMPAFLGELGIVESESVVTQISCLVALVPRGIILLGFETDDAPELRERMSDDFIHSVKEGKRVILVNPQGEYKIRQGDALFLIAESEPTAL